MSIETVDDGDPRMSYSEDSWEPAAALFKQTVHETYQQGAQANLTFEATKGSSVTVISITEETRTDGPTVNFTVDGCEAPVYQQTLNSLDGPSKRTVFECVTTADGNYTLRINVLKVSTHPFMLDAIELRGPTNDTTEPFSATPSAEYGPTETSNTSNASDGSTSGANVGGIVGGVIAALAVLTLLVVFILYRKRKLLHSQKFKRSLYEARYGAPLPQISMSRSRRALVTRPPTQRITRLPADYDSQLPTVIQSATRSSNSLGSMLDILSDAATNGRFTLASRNPDMASDEATLATYSTRTKGSQYSFTKA